MTEARDLYAELGVERDASQDEIEAAYRKLAQKFHPDKETGNAEQFATIASAYRILGDPDLRLLYDKTGDWASLKPLDADVLAEFNKLAMATLKIIPIGHSLVDAMRMQIEGKREEFRGGCAQLREDRVRVEWHRSQLRSKKPPPNLLDSVYLKAIADINRALAQKERMVIIGDKMLEALDGFESGVLALGFTGPFGSGGSFQWGNSSFIDSA